MVDKLQRPLVVGSVTLAIAIGLIELINQTIGEWGVYALLVLAVSAGVWWVQKSPKQRQSNSTLPAYVDSTLVKQTLAEAEQVIGRLQAEVEESDAHVAGMQPQVLLFQSQVNQIATELDREAVRLLVMGAKGSGKTSLIQRLQESWQVNFPKPVTLLEAPSFSLNTEAELSADAIALQQSMTADLVLFLVTGDLTESDLQTLKQLATRKRTLLVFNKQDQYLPDEQQTLLARLQTWGRSFFPAADVVAIATDPRPLKVRQHQPDGSLREWLEEQPPNITPLTQRLTAILQTESRQLVLASSLGSAQAVKAQAASVLNDLRRTRALPIVEQFQWIAAGTAFASPLPSLDVLATAAINVQMILDLGKIYQQSFSVDQAQKVVTALGSLILKLGLVELSTRAIASLLKTNAITYIAGGCIQAVSAAYLTRLAGLTLIEYFHTQEPNLTMADAKPLAIERLGQILPKVFQQDQQQTIFQTLTRQVLDRLTPKPTPTPTPTASSSPSSSSPTPNSQPLSPIPLKLPEVAIAEPLPAKPE
ncbi:uncharacterized protein associated with GTPases [Leptolyngbyaceae cyanobacterium JSC-12]|nr:uncharacterized protein associated with GTPases [Leptolyngbyaceae cyanobacterium JSC-12]